MSVTLVICDHHKSPTLQTYRHHIGGNSWKLIARTNNPTPLLFAAKGDPPTPRGTQGNLGEIRGGVRKKWHAGCWRTKAAISLKRVKIGESYYGRPMEITQQRSFDRYHPDPLWPPLPQNLGFATPTENCNLKFWTTEC